MKKYTGQSILSIGLATLCLFTTPLVADVGSLDAAFSQSTYSGHLRFGYISSDADVPATNSTTASAVGGFIKFETAKWNDLQFSLAPYFSEKIGSLSGDESTGKLNADFFDSNLNSFAYLGELYTQYNWKDGQLRYGRQLIETPFINGDDLRMLLHSYEATWVNHTVSDNLKLQGGVVTRWAGLGHGASQDTFEEASNEGVTVLGITYQMNTQHSLQIWQYDFDKNYSLTYFDAAYVKGNFEAGAQYGNFREYNNSNVDGSFYGLLAQYNFEPVTIIVAYNKASNDAGKSVSAGLGVGNFYTTMDDSFIADKTDAEAYRLGLDYAVNQNLNISLGYGHYEDANKATVDTDEQNIIVTYNVSKTSDIEFIHVVIDNAAAPLDTTSNVTRQLLRANYRF